MTEEARALPRMRDIEAAIAAYNDADNGLLLPPEAGRLLAVMFRRSSVYRRTIGNLEAQGFEERTVRRLLRALIQAGFVSKEPIRRGIPVTYQLHLPPRRRR